MARPLIFFNSMFSVPSYGLSDISNTFLPNKKFHSEDFPTQVSPIKIISMLLSSIFILFIFQILNI